MRPLRYFKLWLALGWLIIFVVIALSLLPQSHAIPIGSNDKIAHFIAYAVLMGWFVQLFQHRGWLLMHAVMLVVLGVALEYAQAYTGRHFDYRDMLANSGGVLLGLVLWLTPMNSLLLRWERRWFTANH